MLAPRRVLRAARGGWRSLRQLGRDVCHHRLGEGDRGAGNGCAQQWGRLRCRSISCSGAGECAAGGYYTDGSDHYQAYVADRKKGVWGAAAEVPGTARSTSAATPRSYRSRAARPASVRPAAGTRTAPGTRRRSWRPRRRASGGTRPRCPARRRSTRATDEVAAVSCGARGDCAAVGYYTDDSGHIQAFVASEKKGVWGNAVEVPGTAALNSGGSAGAFAVSCAAAGECAAGGNYRDGSTRIQVFVVSEKNGAWGSATRRRARGHSTAGASPFWTRSRVPRPVSAPPAATTTTPPLILRRSS